MLAWCASASVGRRGWSAVANVTACSRPRPKPKLWAKPRSPSADVLGEEVEDAAPAILGRALFIADVHRRGQLCEQPLPAVDFEKNE